MSSSGENIDAINEILASLAAGHEDLETRLKRLIHTVSSKSPSAHVHAHYLPFQSGKPTVDEFINVLITKVAAFCIPRGKLNEARKKWAVLPPNKIHEAAIALHNKALGLFKRASRASNRNGEFGELLVFLLIEWILNAPQLVAKMSLKTNPQMPVHGSDGIHIKFDADGALRLLWGESKCYSDVSQALMSAAESISEAQKPANVQHELFILEQHADLSPFSEDQKERILSFLDPYDDNYNKRRDTSVVLIMFDFKEFASLGDIQPDTVDVAFRAALADAMPELVKKLDNALGSHGLQHQSVEVFFLPIPSVKDMRARFQDKIGWTI